ncbi:MAG: hypothetical protein AB7I30_21895 [Isosphaeraceae bacterium]
MSESNRPWDVAREFLGAAIGAVAGHYLFGWIVGQGFYAMILPGAALGLGCALVARRPSQRRGVLCALGAVLLGFHTEWSFFPFRDDRSLGYFVRNLTDLSSISFVMIAIGAAVAYYLAKDAGFSTIGRAEPRP